MVISLVAIGGDKLSRGLTLEGLSVSYFLRASAMFDTLMQMGRWFGYRPRYVDLCRVYTTPKLYSAFREISLATDELRKELDYMATINDTPENFGIRVNALTLVLLDQLEEAGVIAGAQSAFYLHEAGNVAAEVHAYAYDNPAAHSVTAPGRSPMRGRSCGRSRRWFVSTRGTGIG